MLGAGYLTDHCKVSIAITNTAGAAGTADVNGAILNMAGWDGVLMIVQFGAIVAGAVTSIKAQQDTVVGFGGAADILGSAQTVADTDDDKCFMIDLKRPTEQFVRVVVDRGTQNATCSAVYVQYRGRGPKPVSQGSNVAFEAFHAPAEGTA